MNDMIIKPLEPDFFKKACKESWFILKVQYVSLILSALLFYGLVNTILSMLVFQVILFGMLGIFIALYISQLMILIRASSNMGLDLIVEVLTSLPSMFFLYTKTSKKSILLSSTLFLLLVLFSNFIFKSGSLDKLAYSSLLLFFGIFIGLLENTFILFLVAHQQSKESDCKEYVDLIMKRIMLEGGSELIKKIIFTTGLIVIISSVLPIGAFSIIIFFLLGLFYSSILYQMIEKPKKRTVVLNTEALNTEKIVDLEPSLNKV